MNRVSETADNRVRELCHRIPRWATPTHLLRDGVMSLKRVYPTDPHSGLCEDMQPEGAQAFKRSGA